jgi:hypothetical protein
MSEAKDWAGELISGQTGTGRILVCVLINVAEPDPEMVSEPHKNIKMLYFCTI